MTRPRIWIPIAIAAAALAAVLWAPWERLGDASPSGHTGINAVDSAPPEAAATDAAPSESRPRTDSTPASTAARTAAGAPRASARLTGILLAADGSPLRRTSFVSAFFATPTPSAFLNWSSPAQCVEANPVTGEFRITGLDAGPYRLRIDTIGMSSAFGSFFGPVVWTDAGGGRVEILTPYRNLEDHWCLELRIAYPTVPVGVESARVRLPSGEERWPVATIAGGSYILAFDDLPDGPCDVRIEHPLYKPWQLTNATRASNPVKVQMSYSDVGGEILVRVSDASTGELIPGAVCTFGDAAERFFLTRATMDATEPAAVKVSGLPAIELRGHAGAPGYADRVEKLAAVPAGVTRALDIHLTPFPSLQGRLVGADGSSPEHGVYIYAWMPKDDLDDNRDGSYAGYARTNADGTFRIPVKEAGTYVVTADWGCGVKTSTPRLTLGAARPVSGLRLMKPPTLTLRGRILAAPGTDFRGMTAYAESAAGGWTAVRHGPIASDGSFELAPFTPGPLRLSVYLGERSALGPVDAPAVLELTLPTDRGLSVPLGTIELDSETAARPIELRLGGELNTYADVVVLVNGRPAPRACVRVASAEAPRALASLGVASQEGRARVGPVPPGPLQIEIVDPEQDWTWIHTAQPVAAAGVVNTIVVDVPVHAGTVHFTDSSGMPLSHARLSLVYSGAVIARQVTTDSEGRVKLSYPPGQLYPARIGAPGDPWGSNSKGAFEAVALPWPAAAESFVKLP